MKPNYLLIDYGNSYIKAAIYDSSYEKIIEYKNCPRTVNAREILSRFLYLGDRHPTKVIESITASADYAQPFNGQLKKLLNCDIRIVSRPDFEKILDLSNIPDDVFIGSDIMLCAYYASKQFKESFVLSLGTAYFGIVLKNKQIINTFLFPSISKGMEHLATLTTIPRDYIPEEYDMDKSTNTRDAFATGANWIIDGFIQKVVNEYKLKPEQVFLTGGDVYRFVKINKKYKETKNMVLLALAELLKEKDW